MIKDKLYKFVNQIHIEEHHEKKEYDRGNITRGEIQTSSHYAERFMNVVINNPNLLDDLHLNFQTNYFVFINDKCFHCSSIFRKILRR